MTKIPCGGFMLGEGLVLSEDGKTLNVSGGGTDDVYVIKHITNYDTSVEEVQGDYEGALAAFNSGKRLKFVEAAVAEGKEIVVYESFAYHLETIDSFCKFVCYSGNNFPTCKLEESGITVSSNDTYVGSLCVDFPGGLYLKSNSNKLFSIKVSDTGELSTEEITQN